MIMKDINWKWGLKINGEVFTHFRFTDDIVLFAENVSKFQTMLQEPQVKSSAVGLKINHAKNQVREVA